MTKKFILPCLAAGVMVSGLSACSTIKSLFPDKERDYQFTSEVPDLIVPDDLKSDRLDSLPNSSVQAAAPETERLATSDIVAEPIYSGEAEPAASDAAATNTETSKAEIESAPEKTEASSPSTVSSLQIDQAKMPATRLVGKALTRKQVEIVERNIDRGYYYVKYDPYAVEAKDESIWDELNFLFGEDPSQEQEYRITVKQIGEQMSEVTVQDSSGKDLSNPVANVLLKLITDGINEDLYPDAAEDASKTNGDPKTPESTSKE